MGLFDRFRSSGRADAGVSKGTEATAEQAALRLIDEGNAIELAGRLEEAMQRYDAAVALAPNLARAHLNRGNILLEMGNPEGALQAYATALDRNPAYAAGHYNIGNACVRSGRREAALAAYRQALALQPDFVDAEVALGGALEDLGQLDDAVASYRRALSINPDYAEVHSNLGNVLRKLGRSGEAMASYRRALALRPYAAEMQNRLGNVFQELGDTDEALACFRRAVAAKPDYAEAHINLGNTLTKRGQIDDAMASYRRALTIMPDSVEAHNNLGNALKDVGQLDDAVASLERALAVKPDSAEVLCNLGAALHERAQLDEAAAVYRRALTLKPDFVAAHKNLGITLTARGRLDAAIESLNRALAITPDAADVHSDLLFVHNYLADQPATRLVAAARRYGDIVAHQARPHTTWGNSRAPARRLRVGLVSGDLCNHPVGHFAESVLAALASDQIEIFAYPSSFASDAITERIKASCRGWYSAVGLSDERLAQRIRDDRIDILIDLAGHTAHNRLSMFAWKPAPVQASWLGYFATTGVGAIDYLIADPWTLPEAEEVNFTEKIWRLPETRLCFTAPDEAVDVAPLPALGNGYITFGCFNHLTKVNEGVVALWAKVLAVVPHSRLFLKSGPMNEASVQQEIAARFGAHGIAADRLVLEGRSPLADYLAAYGRVDIALDPFPYTGGATSVLALWMGVPVLTLAGEHFLSRQGVGLLMNAGLPEWIAVDGKDYVARAVSHADDWPRLAALRSGLRQQLCASPIFDATRFATHFAAALRGMWQEWCNRPSSGSGTPG